MTNADDIALGRLAVNTARDDQSIWQGVGRDTFRKHIIGLQQASNEVPSDPVVYSASEWLATHGMGNGLGYSLPMDVEQRLADDLAFIAAAEEGPKEVSAVALEEQVDPPGLLVLLAANEKFPIGVEDMLKACFRLLSHCASRKVSRESCARSLFDLVIEVNKNRIHGRLQSLHWKRPKSRVGPKARNPLHRDLRKVAERLEQRHIPGYGDSISLVQQIKHLCDMMHDVDKIGAKTDNGEQLMKEVIIQSYGICTSEGTQTLEETVTRHGFDPGEVTSNKHIRQLNKIGRYWGLCTSMTDDSRRYSTLFANAQLRPLRPYQGMSSHISFIDGQRARCLVHAEMQIIAFYGNIRNTSALVPRVIGASKSACYLCNLFIQLHGQFFITKTHGHLYERWNFPDLADFKPVERVNYRRVLSAMDNELQAAYNREIRATRRRGLPMGSWLTLPPARSLSPAPSTISNSPSGENRNGSAANGSIISWAKSPLQGEEGPRAGFSTIAASLSTGPGMRPIQATSPAPSSNPLYKLRSDSQIPPAPSPPQSQSTEAATTQSRAQAVPLGALNPALSIKNTLKVPGTPEEAPTFPASEPYLTTQAHRQTPPPLSPPLSSPLSSPLSTSLSRKFPTYHNVLPTRPIHILIGKLSLTIEIEEPARGTAAIMQRDSSGSSGRDGVPIVDVGEMKEGEVRELKCNRDGEVVTFNLQYGKEVVDIELGWV